MDKTKENKILDAVNTLLQLELDVVENERPMSIVSLAELYGGISLGDPGELKP